MLFLCCLLPTQGPAVRCISAVAGAPSVAGVLLLLVFLLLLASLMLLIALCFRSPFYCSGIPPVAGLLTVACFPAVAGISAVVGDPFVPDVRAVAGDLFYCCCSCCSLRRSTYRISDRQNGETIGLRH
jgi:hypothetical protein